MSFLSYRVISSLGHVRLTSTEEVTAGQLD